MSKVRWGALGGVAVAMTVAGMAWSQGASTPEETTRPAPVMEPRPGSPADLEQDVRALRAELAELRRSQAALARQPAPEPSRPPSAAEEPVASRPPGEATLAAAEVARQERRQELEAELEVAAHTEPRDPDWARSTEALVTQAFHGGGISGSRLVGVECRTHLCTLEVEHDGPEGRMELLPSLTLTPGLQGQAVLSPRTEGSRQLSRVYLSRAGERLPMTLRR
ncbi:hypothetical protein LZ198_33055 [Myxococcus sp. K15C18031901]|uniref:hypothetical protein n=1 Tax=Myxococcus dinghuensis TaxID=2906761 RepID=UPI0020A703E5|nr:hypothetical protein [Myxococcus dinghuensis]MCP3103723.1 hypothetical protein [Myxococcus dinghuensis]